ncbi:MAG: DDE-type integrase/transposase/recombinase [Gammaproteobacteria bacterium]|nr:transposase family protein [Sideroxydans sp.]MBU3904191.1 DDE-type integrase/transposase/recombinase [Gammaproteobacteria bacterium]
MKAEMLGVIAEAKDEGVSNRRSCDTLTINRRRVVYWQERQRAGLSMDNGQPGPVEAAHALLVEEREQVVALARVAEYADLSHRMLTVTGWVKGLTMVSFSTTYRVLCSAGLMAMRGHHRGHNGHSVAPVRKELSGPNQRWCWDISYLPTFERGVFLYLYLVLDEWSRKVIQWLVSWSLEAGEAKRLLDAGMVAENILDLPEEQRPEVVNDRGRQMKAKSVRRLFEEHSMPQLFARPRTPNDNPFIEAMFSTTKTAPEYPGRFLDKENAEGYFGKFFAWYDNEHYHSGIDYVTPAQAHAGLRAAIVAERKARMEQQRILRKEVNRHRQWTSGTVLAPRMPTEAIGGMLGYGSG